MSQSNYFFKLTGTAEKYTEEHLTKVVSDILVKDSNIDFNSLYNMVSDYYSEVKVNRSAVEGLAYSKFNIGKKPVYQSKKASKNFFFGKQDADEKHTEKYLITLIEQILDAGPKTKESIYDDVKKSFDGERINYSALKILLDEEFVRDGELYYSDSHKQNTSYKKTTVKGANYHYKKTKYILELNKLTPYSYEQLNKEYFDMVSEHGFDIMSSITISVSSAIKYGAIDINKGAEICVTIDENLDYYQERIKSVIHDISPKNYNLSCVYFISNESILKKLAAGGLLTAEDFLNSEVEVILGLISLEVDGTLQELANLSTSYEVRAENTICKVIEGSLSERYSAILLKRYGGFIDEAPTFEAIGEEYGITRERVRQIVSKANKKLADVSFDVKRYVKFYFSHIIEPLESSFIRVKDILDICENKDAFLNACMLLEPCNSNYKYDEKYHIIYDDEQISVDDIEKEVIERFGKLIAVSRYDSANELDKEIIDHNYTLSGRQNNLYHLKYYNQTEYLIELISELFPNGYRLYNEDDYEVLANEYANRLGYDVEVPSITAVRGIIGREGGLFCQIDKGTYKLRSECPNISMDFFDKIYDFIVANLPIVDYITIYKKYEHEFKKYGIDNYYYMKGVIDNLLPDDLTTQRNYITASDNRISAVDARLNYMHSFEKAFTLDDLIEKYPGVKPYVFQFLCYDEEKNGLIHIGIRKYIYADRLNISSEQREIIIRIVEETFEKNNTNILSSRKIFARIKLLYPNLIKDIPFLEGQHATFSIIKYLFPNEYYFDRPYISKVKPDEERITTSGIILNYLNAQSSVDYDKYKNFCLKMNIPMIFSYMQLVEELSEEFVQINDRQLIRKDSFNISEKDLQEINQIMEMIFARTDKIETSNFNGYMLFPIIRHKWNKHVLAGIVRSFFSDKYEVINITNASVSEAVDYEIVRCVA